MKLFAQHGHAPSDKITRAVEERIINGVIFSPRYLTPSSAQHLIGELKNINNEIEIFIDPEFYATRYIGTPNAQLRYLEEWQHFFPTRQNELLVGTEKIDDILRITFQNHIEMGCTGLLAPNIYISNSFDSIEAAIAISIINRTKPIAQEMGIELPVYATLAVGRDAIVDQRSYLHFLNTVTAISPLPDGIYILVGAGSTDERVGTIRSEILSPDVIAGWMLLNYSLSLNGLSVINGFSDILTPFLGAVGAQAGATGWWTNLQVFSMGRYIKGKRGGQLPVIRYLSKKLINRITFNEREAFVEVVPEILNNLTSDSFYIEREPSRTEETIQAWQAISSLNEDIISGDIEHNLRQIHSYILEAENIYNLLQSHGFSDRYESNQEYLSALKNGTNLFGQLAELY